MYSPYVQNERHINLIKEILGNGLGYKYKLKRIESMIVVANPKTVINKSNSSKEISKVESIKAFMVFSNDTMEDIIEKHPKNIVELKKIKGFGTVNCEKYGEYLLNITK